MLFSGCVPTREPLQACFQLLSRKVPSFLLHQEHSECRPSPSAQQTPHKRVMTSVWVGSSRELSRRCVYIGFLGEEFSRVEISSPELVTRPGIGGIWGLLGFQAQGLVVFELRDW